MKTPYLFLIIIICISCKKQDIHADKQLEPGYFTKPSDKSNNKQSYITNSEDFDQAELIVKFAIIDSYDGYALLEDYNTSATDTLLNFHPVLCMEPAGDVTGIDYVDNDSIRHGYVENNQLKYINGYDVIPITQVVKESVTLFGDAISITLKSEPFVQSKHKLHYQDNFLYTIDNDSIWGTDGNIPKIQYQSITISFDNKTIEIPAKGLHNLYEPNLDYTSAYYDKENDILYLQTFNSDAAGAYAVLWVIEKGIYKERLVVYPF